MPEAPDYEAAATVLIVDHQHHGTEGNPELVTLDEIFQNEIPLRSKAEEHQ